MRRSEADQVESDGQDSFLDVVANMVGILILLVMVVGVRASKLPRSPSPDEEQSSIAAAPAEGDSHPVSGAAAYPRRVATLQSEVQDLVQQVAATEQEERLREMERVQLAAHALEIAQQLKQREEKLTADERSKHEVLQKLQAARARLDELAEAQMAVMAAPHKIEKIENLPTPLAHTVRGDELHLRLKGDLVSVIPLDELVSDLEEHARSNAWKLAGQSVLEETLGPVGGYRLRYRIVQRRVVAQSAAGPINQGNVAQLEGWEVLPVTEDLGQPVDQALMPGSELRRALADKRPETTTITVWTYPDSFDAFRRLKEELFEMGYATAARPLPERLRIGGSPRGSKSEAQ